MFRSNVKSKELNPRRWASETLPKSWRCSESTLSFESRASERSRRSESSGSSSSVSRGSRARAGGEVVRWAGRPAAVTRASHGVAAATDIFVEMPPQRTHFSGFGKSYHFSCVSPFQFTYPYVVYI